MTLPEHTPQFDLLEEALTVLFCRVEDDIYYRLNPRGRRYETLQRAIRFGGRDARPLSAA